MALPKSKEDREQQKFVADTNDNVAVRIEPSDDFSFTIGSQETIPVSIHHQVNIGDISAGTQTNDLKITLDGEEVIIYTHDNGDVIGSTDNLVLAGIRNSAGNASYLQGTSDNADGLAVSGGGNNLRVTSITYKYNGTTFDRWTGEVKTPVLTNDGADDGDFTSSLTANTATQIPSTVPAYDYVLILGNRSDTAMIWGVTNSIATGSALTRGIPLQATTGTASIKLKANESVFVACSAAKDLDYTIMSIKEAS